MLSVQCLIPQLLAGAELDLPSIEDIIPAKISSLEALRATLVSAISRKVADRELAELLAYHYIGLGKLLPLLLHEDISEIYIEEDGRVYVDHKKLGRLLTNISLSKLEIERLTLICEFFGRTTISESNPSLKTELVTRDFTIRVSIDAPPLVERYTIDIRKLSFNISLADFIYSDSDVALLSAIIFHFAKRKNILLIGEPGSGKTTLASLLVNMAPRYWRVIVIEDVREAPLKFREGLIRIRVNPLESRFKYSKEREILKLLHRSPDYVFVGELQTPSDFKAFFHAISAGIKGIATTHSSSLEEFLDRLINSIGIEKNRLQNVDMLVFMERTLTKNSLLRRIARVYLTYKGKFVELRPEDVKAHEVELISKALMQGDYSKLQKIIEDVSSDVHTYEEPFFQLY